MAYASNAEIHAAADLDLDLVVHIPIYELVAEVTSDETYDALMVERLLAADKMAPEATFSNVVDMLDWLERD